METVKTLNEMKPVIDAALKAGQPVAGMQFLNDKGSVGTILPGLSARGKLQASMTCVEGGPDHIRERSDWHQCYLSPDKAKNKPRKTGGPGTGKSMRTEDGTLLRFQEIFPADSAEIQAVEEQNNIAFEAAKAARASAEASAKATKLADRKSKLEARREERRLAKEAETAAKLAEGAKKLQEYAASLNVAVSPNAAVPPASTETVTA